MKLLGAALIGLLAAACIPPTSSSDYDVPFARQYWSRDAGARPPLASLSVEQLYALHQYGRRAFHPWRSVAPALACRGGAAIPFLKTKIQPVTLGSLLEVFAWMRWMGTYDVHSDVDLGARIAAAYRALPRDLRDSYANSLAAVEGRPQSGRYAWTPAGTPEQLRAAHCSA